MTEPGGKQRRGEETMRIPNQPRLGTKAVVYVQLCRGSHIAAALFDWILTYTEIDERLRYHEPFYVYVESAYGHLADPGPFQNCFGYTVDVDACLEVTLSDMRAIVIPQLLPPAEITDQALFEALELLRNIHLVSWHCYGEGERSLSELLFSIGTLFLPQIHEALTTLYYGHQVTGAGLQVDLTRERRIVREQCSRAGRIGQAASLTLEEWRETITYFNGKCAFFPEHPYEVLEHFIPVVYGGGTTVIFSWVRVWSSTSNPLVSCNQRMREILS
jgi:hypothetical protein